MSAGESMCLPDSDTKNNGQSCNYHNIVIYFQAYSEKMSEYADKAQQENRTQSEKKLQSEIEKEHCRLQHNIGRELLKLALEKEYQIDFTEEMIFFAHNGKPMLKSIEEKNPIHFNISHCKDMVVCALSDCPIGIDIESSRNITDRMIRQVCNEQERQYIAMSNHADAFLELWTLKESYLKMTGEGMRIPVNQVNFSIFGSEIQSNRVGYYYQTKLANQYILAVCSKEPCNEPQLIRVQNNM